ncbi:hypothetical protein BK144_08175 [Paenibacillus sp. FSL R7-0273]|nr:hypothetical protein BK144_08175 [Paenibacillus sp. FSL R7-0273]
MAEGNFGTVGAIATAFVCGFQPCIAVQLKKSVDNSGRKSKHSLESRLTLNYRVVGERTTKHEYPGNQPFLLFRRRLGAVYYLLFGGVRGPDCG